MMTTLSSLISLITIFSIFSFISQRQQILMCLLSLEAILLSLAFSAIISLSSPIPMHFFFCIVILTFGACEAAVALAVLVSITRSFGSDMVHSVNLNKC